MHFLEPVLDSTFDNAFMNEIDKEADTFQSGNSLEKITDNNTKNSIMLDSMMHNIAATNAIANNYRYNRKEKSIFTRYPSFLVSTNPINDNKEVITGILLEILDENRSRNQSPQITIR